MPDHTGCVLVGHGMIADAVAAALGPLRTDAPGLADVLIAAGTGDARGTTNAVVTAGPPGRADARWTAGSADVVLSTHMADIADTADMAGAVAPRGDGPVVVVAADGWDTRPYRRVQRVCAAGRLTWLPVRAELGRVVVGPRVRPGLPGCVWCAEERRRRARPEPLGHQAVMERHGDTLADRPSSWLTPQAADLVAALVADEVGRIRSGEPARTAGALLLVDLADLAVGRHSFLPVPRCAECGALPADDARRARVTLRSRPKPAPSVYRVRKVRLEDLERIYVDEECGLVRKLFRDDDGGLAVSAATVGLRGGAVESGYGRTRDYHSSGVTAVLEALERHGGMEPGGRRTTVSGSYAELRESAVDPRAFGLHPPESYRLPGFPFRPFDEDAACRWVWAYSFGRGAPVLVPEAHAYYGLRHADPARPPFSYEISNGCALGGCLEEAILHGVLEVAERDAFLMTWYARMEVARIELGSARDRVVPLIAHTLEAGTGYRVSVFDTTLEQGIPCVWAMAVNPSDDDGRPKAVCAAGSHPDLERAAENALRELGPALGDLLRRYPARRDAARAMARDPSLVTGMADHSLLYGNPEVFGRLRFLAETPAVRHLTGAPASSAALANADLRDDLEELLRRYLGDGLDVLVVDQTSPEHRAGGFACVKVLIPGTLPMTFGHDRRRLEGLPRLYRVPGLLGHRDPLPGHVGAYPHPFP
ncbi:TOMM precursor leader peptide-binding protein [Streptosporangium sp. NPDC023615]|uniref:TOMM precursor leader peptide-binding protein n=1 Tax=Streptosporangium sp. NPDC023615 TaxID=3154794 RepID=UPI00344132C2